MHQVPQLDVHNGGFGRPGVGGKGVEVGIRHEWSNLTGQRCVRYVRAVDVVAVRLQPLPPGLQGQGGYASDQGHNKKTPLTLQCVPVFSSRPGQAGPRDALPRVSRSMRRVRETGTRTGYACRVADRTAC